MLQEGWGEMMLNEQQPKKKAEFLAVGEANKAIFLQTPGLKERTLNLSSSGSSADGT